MTWLFNNEPFDYENYKQYFGFVYIITNLKTNQKYIGKKYFKHKKTYQKNNKKYKMSVESDWKTYYSSSEKIKQEIKEFGNEHFKREIIALGETSGVVNFLEVHFQIKYGVLFNEEYINDNINGKYYKSLVSTYPSKSILNENHHL